MDGVNSEEDPMTELGKSLGMKKVLVHGDCWSTNFLWRKKENSEDLVLAAMVDFQVRIYVSLSFCLSVSVS